MSRHNVKGMTLTDLIVGLVLCVLLMVALVPAAGILDDARNKSLCTRNLTNIAAALVTYSNTNNGKYPRTYYNFQNPDTLTAYSGWKAKDPFSGDGVKPNDVTAGLYLLIRSEKLNPAFFVCPATKTKTLQFGAGAGAIAATPTDIANFPSEEYLSYSGECPFPTMQALTTQWVWDSTLATDCPLICDMNPGGEAVLHVTRKSTAEELRKANSLNHDGTGQNVLYGDYHVESQKTPFCGSGDDKDNPRDNIFVRSTLYHGGDKPAKIELKGDPIMGPPCDIMDNVMLPPAGWKPTAQTKEK